MSCINIKLVVILFYQKMSIIIKEREYEDIGTF